MNSESIDNAIQDASKKLKLYSRLSALIIVIGVALMVIKIYADSEPGGIPILLIVFGLGWYLVTRARSHRRREV